MTFNRFDEVAIYFAPLAKQGVCFLFRAPTLDEMAHFDTRHVLIVRSVRDGSPGDLANMMEGDAVLTVNGQGASMETLHAASEAGGPIALHLVRNG